MTWLVKVCNASRGRRAERSVARFNASISFVPNAQNFPGETVSSAYANCISIVTKCSCFFQHFCILLLPTGVLSNQYPQGYYPFEESPAKIPPKVRKPPYLQTSVPCPGVSDDGASDVVEPTLDNLCGDLNKGYLPLNPIGQSVEGVSYPL